MSEGGETRNHEAEVEALRSVLGPWIPPGRLGEQLVRAALDAVRRSPQGLSPEGTMPSEATEAGRWRSPQGEDQIRIVRDDGGYQGIDPPQGEDHEPVADEFEREMRVHAERWTRGGRCVHCGKTPGDCMCVIEPSPERNTEKLVEALAVAELYVRENRVRGRDAVQDHALVRAALAEFRERSS